MLPIGSTAGLTAAQKYQLQCAQRDLAALQPNATTVAGASGGGDAFASLFAEAEGGEEEGGDTGDESGGLLGGLDSFATLSPAALRNLYGTPVAGGGAPMKHAASHHAAAPTTSTTTSTTAGRPATQVGGVSGGGTANAATGPAGLAQVLGQLQPILTQVSALLGAPRTAMPAGTGAGTVAGGGPTTDAVAGANSIGTTPSLAASLAELVSVLKELTQAINSAVSSGRLTLGGGPGKGSTTQAGGTVQSGTAPLPGSTVAGAGGAVANGAPANGAQPAAPGAAAAAAPAATTPAAPNAAAPAAAATAAPAAAATTPDVTPIPGSATGLGAGTTTLPPVGNTTLVAAEAAGTGEPTNDPVMPTLADGEGVGEVPPAPAD